MMGSLWKAVVVVGALALAAANAAASWDNWNCNLRTYWGELEGAPKDVGDYFGVMPGATDGCDLVDARKPSEPMGKYVYAWFERRDWGMGRIMADWRATIAEGATKRWGTKIIDTWNVKTSLDNGPSGYFDPDCDALQELEYPVAASIYITWELGVSEFSPRPLPPDDYTFTLTYAGGINAKPAGTAPARVTVPAVNTQWDMEAVFSIVIPLWNDAFQPWTADCADLRAADTAKFFILVNNPDTVPTCTVSVDPNAPQRPPATFALTASAGCDEPFAFTWDFGDGVSGTGNPVSHTYGSVGTYTVTCTATDANGDGSACTAQAEVAGPPKDPPTCEVTYDPHSPTTDDLVSFSAGAGDADGTVVSVDWDFGDGGTASGDTATHQYAMPGTYVVAVTVCDNDGFCTTCQAEVTVEKGASMAPACDVACSPPSPGAGQTVTLYANAYDPNAWGVIVSYEWDFGDGGTASGDPATHQYAIPGTYTVTVRVCDDDGMCTTCSAEVTVTSEPPICCFGWEPESPMAYDPVQFIDCSWDPDGGNVVAWAWNFSDGGWSSMQNPTHSFPGGCWVVSLTVADDDSPPASATCSQTICVEELLCLMWLCVRVQDCDGYQLPGPADIGVTAPDGTSWTQTLNPYGYTWVEVPVESCGGTYSITGPPGWRPCEGWPTTQAVPIWDWACDWVIDVTFRYEGPSFPSPPTCDIAYDPDSPTADETITFYAAASDPDGSVVSVDWDFGDGGTASGDPATHQYEMPGTYTVAAIVCDDDGLCMVCTAEVTIRYAPPDCCFGWEPESPMAYEPVQFTDCSWDPDGGNVVAWAWDFGDGGTSTEQSPTHEFSEGCWEVCLTVTEDDFPQASATCCQTIGAGVTGPGCPVWLHVCVQDCGGDPAWYPGEMTVTGPDGSSWTQMLDADGCTWFEVPVLCRATYWISGPPWPCDGWPDTETIEISASDCYTVVEVTFRYPRPVTAPPGPPPAPPSAPTCSISYEPESPTTNDTIVFDSGAADSDGMVVSADWDFWDGSTASGDPAAHRYPRPGIYMPSVTVCDDDGLCVMCYAPVTVSAPCWCDVAIDKRHCKMPAAGHVGQCKRGEIGAKNMSHTESCNVVLRVTDNADKVVFESEPIMIGPGRGTRVRFDHCYTGDEVGRNLWTWEVWPVDCAERTPWDNVRQRRVNVHP